MPLDSADFRDHRISTAMRWQSVALFLSLALLTGTTVAFVGWLIWISRY